MYRKCLILYNMRYRLQKIPISNIIYSTGLYTLKYRFFYECNQITDFYALTRSSSTKYYNIMINTLLWLSIFMLANTTIFTSSNSSEIHKYSQSSYNNQSLLSYPINLLIHYFNAIYGCRILFAIIKENISDRTLLFSSRVEWK